MIAGFLGLGGPELLVLLFCGLFAVGLAAGTVVLVLAKNRSREQESAPDVRSVGIGNSPGGTRNMNVADEIQKLQQLRQTGAITEEEFAVAKARLINGPPAAAPYAEAPARSAAVGTVVIRAPPVRRRVP